MLGESFGAAVGWPADEAASVGVSQGDRIQTRRLFVAEERRGCTVVSVTVGLRSEITRVNITAIHARVHARTHTHTHTPTPLHCVLGREMN